MFLVLSSPAAFFGLPRCLIHLHCLPSQLVFQAILGGTGTSDIALDDIFIDKGACLGYVAPTGR